MSSYKELEKKLNKEASKRPSGDINSVIEEVIEFETAAVFAHAADISEPRKISAVKSFAKDTYLNIHDSIHAISPKQVDKLAEILDKKNHDYGNSFDKLTDKYGDVAMSIRISDKLSRLQSLAKSGKNEVQESIEDTLVDILGYLLLIINYKGDTSLDD